MGLGRTSRTSFPVSRLNRSGLEEGFIHLCAALRRLSSHESSSLLASNSCNPSSRRFLRMHSWQESFVELQEVYTFDRHMKSDGTYDGIRSYMYGTLGVSYFLLT